MNFTEQDSRHQNLHELGFDDLLKGINTEDLGVAVSVQEKIDQIAKLSALVHDRMSQGGRLFYLGAGTSGRLGIVDASECPPTYGVEHGRVIGIIAGGDSAIRKAVEFAEDDMESLPKMWWWAFLPAAEHPMCLGHCNNANNMESQPAVWFVIRHRQLLRWQMPRWRL